MHKFLLYEVGTEKRQSLNFSRQIPIYALTEAVLNYRSMNSNVYSCFLDASKAFERVNQYVLFDKLVKRGAPLYTDRILVFWYNVQKMYIYDGIIPCLTVFRGTPRRNSLSLSVLCLHG